MKFSKLPCVEPCIFREPLVLSETCKFYFCAYVGICSMPIHILQCMFHVQKLSCTHKFFHKYKQTSIEKFVQAYLPILMGEVV